MTREEEIYSALRRVLDPELGINVVDLGLVYNVVVDDPGDIEVLMTLTVQGCPMHDTIRGDVARVLASLPWATSCKVDLTFDPPWSPERISPRTRALLGA